MTLLEALPKDKNGMIITPVGGYINGQPVEGRVNPAWFEKVFPDLASATVPLSDADLKALKSIDRTWAKSAEHWRVERII